MRRAPLIALALSALPAIAAAHGNAPRVMEITLPAQLPGEVWAVTDTQGLFARGPDGRFRWLCEDAITMNAGIRGLAPMGDNPRDWLVATNFGVFRSENAGCDWTPVEGPMARQVPIGLYPHPVRLDEALTATDLVGAVNDVWRTEDGGRTWHPAGLALEGRARRPLIRTPGRPDRVYLAHESGALRSDDAGRSFTPIAPGPPELEVLPGAFGFLGGRPGAPDEIYGHLEQFPGWVLVRSLDAGATWAPVVELDDEPNALVFDDAGREGLITTQLDGVLRSDDGGETWRHEPTAPVPLLGCVTRAPGGSALWGCSNVYFDGPWVVGSSQDFGRTWRPALPTFTTVAERWDCPPESAAATICQTLCPGVSRGAVCGGGGDAGTTPDGGSAPDVGDAGWPPDASAPRGGSGSAGGCRIACHPASPAPWALAVLLLAVSRMVRPGSPRRREGGQRPARPQNWK